MISMVMGSFLLGITGIERGYLPGEFTFLRQVEAGGVHWAKASGFKWPQTMFTCHLFLILLLSIAILIISKSTTDYPNWTNFQRLTAIAWSKPSSYPFWVLSSRSLLILCPYLLPLLPFSQAASACLGLPFGFPPSSPRRAFLFPGPSVPSPPLCHNLSPSICSLPEFHLLFTSSCHLLYFFL